MKRFLALLSLIGLGFLALLPQPTHAQQWLPGGDGLPVVCAFNTSPPTVASGKFIYAQCDTNGKLITSGGGGGGGAVTGGWLTAVVSSPLSVTTANTTGTVTGSSSITEVLLNNVGTVGAYCGVTATATANYQYIAPSGGWFAFQIAVGSNTVACITASSSTTVNVQTGSGLATGTGGGGGGASGNVFQATAFAEGTVSSATTTQVFAISGSTIIYLVNYSYQTDNAAAGAGTFQIISGTGSNCATPHNILTPTWNFAANAGIAEGSIGVLGASQAGDALCVVTTSANKVNYRIGVVQQ